MNNVRVGKIVDLVKEVVVGSLYRADKRLKEAREKSLGDSLEKFKKSGGHKKFERLIDKINAQVRKLESKHQEEMDNLRKKQSDEMEKIEIKKDPIYLDAAKAGYANANPNKGYYYNQDRTSHDITESMLFYLDLKKYNEIKEKDAEKFVGHGKLIIDLRDKVYADMMNAWTIEDQEELRKFVVDSNKAKREADAVFPE
ncbi:MAG: hypothetical protein ACTSXE_02590 [Candidatus Thorarchaeota archaeon]